MAKLNLLLLLVLVVCALGLVTSQHKSRKLFTELEREQERARALDVEFGQLQLEASTWGLHSRVEKIAAGTLGMRAPDPRRVRMVEPRRSRSAVAERSRELAASVPMLVRLPAWRARLALLRCCSRRSLVLAGRSVYLQSMKTGFLQEKGEARYCARAGGAGHARPHRRPQRRGAGHLDAGEIGLGDSGRREARRPAQLKSLGGAAAARRRASSARKLSDADRDFVYLKRQIPPETAARVAALRHPGHPPADASTAATTPAARRWRT